MSAFEAYLKVNKDPQALQYQLRREIEKEKQTKNQHKPMSFTDICKRYPSPNDTLAKDLVERCKKKQLVVPDPNFPTDRSLDLLRHSQ